MKKNWKGVKSSFFPVVSSNRVLSSNCLKWICFRKGLGVDQMLEVELVGADGSFIIANGNGTFAKSKGNIWFELTIWYENYFY